MSESINRAFMYGESVFTTMRMINGHLRDWNLHFERMKKGVEFVYGPFTDGDDWAQKLKNLLEERIEVQTGDRIIRLTVYREQVRGLLTVGLVSVNDLKLHLSSSPYDPSMSDVRMQRLRMCAGPIRPNWWPDFLKAGDYLERILAQKIFMQPGDDDLLFLSPQRSVLASSVSNIFIVRDNKLFTAPCGPNVLAGIMRKKVIQEAFSFFAGFKESEISIEQLSKATAVFGTNSIKGLFLIDKIDDYHFQYSEDFLTTFEALKKRVLA